MATEGSNRIQSEYEKAIDREVMVELVNGEQVCGNLHTVDPVSGMLVVVDKSVWSATLLACHNCRSIQLVGEGSRDLSELFDDACCSRDSQLRKQNLLRWFSDHSITATETADGHLLVLDLLTIQPPFRPEDCACQHPVVLDRIMSLLEEFDNQIDKS